MAAVTKPVLLDETGQNIAGAINGLANTLGNRAYGTSSTAAATAAKTATISGFKLVTGASVFIKFSNTNTASTPTLNINDGNASTGAKAIRFNGAAFKDLEAGKIYQFVYDGTYYQLVSGGGGSEKYLDTTITTSTSASVTATFTDSAITANSVIDVFTSQLGLNYSAMTISAGSCTVTFPAQASAASVTVRIYIK